MGSNRSWDGTFDTSKEADRSVEQALIDTINGVEIGKASDDGGLIKAYDDGSWEMFGPSDSEKGHWHIGTDSEGKGFSHG